MRPTNFIGLLGCLASLFFAYFFLEGYLKLLPCPLCILDRLVLGLMAIVFFFGLFVEHIRLRIGLLFVNICFLAFGFVFSGRHVWLQNQPFDPTQGCLAADPKLEGITEFMRTAFDAEADCGMIAWQLFGLSIPALTLILFFGLLALLGCQAFGIFQDSLDDEDSDY